MSDNFRTCPLISRICPDLSGGPASCPNFSERGTGHWVEKIPFFPPVRYIGGRVRSISDISDFCPYCIVRLCRQRATALKPCLAEIGRRNEESRQNATSAQALAEAHFLQTARQPGDAGIILEELDGLVDPQVQHVGDGEAAVTNRQRLAVEPLPLRTPDTARKDRAENSFRSAAAPAPGTPRSGRLRC